jgi:hypothetical protein
MGGAMGFGPADMRKAGGAEAGKENKQRTNFGYHWSDESRKSQDFSMYDAETLTRIAQSVQHGQDQQTRSKAQLGLLLSDGSVNYLSTKSLAAGRIPELLKSHGATLLSDFQIRETGYWNPHIATDDQGRAKIIITVPSRSTGWQLATRGITAGTLTGQATTEIVSKKDLFGELKLPAAFIDGDSAQIKATIHNDAVTKGKIEVTLKSTMNGKSREETRIIEVSDKGLHELVFDREIAGPGEMEFELAVKAVGAPVPLDDILQTSVPVRAFGMPVFATSGGSASSNITTWVSPPQGMPVRDTSLEILVGPSVARTLLDVVLGSGTSVIHTSRYHDLLICDSPLDRITSDLLASLSLLKLM